MEKITDNLYIGSFTDGVAAIKSRREIDAIINLSGSDYKKILTLDQHVDYQIIDITVDDAPLTSCIEKKLVNAAKILYQLRRCGKKVLVNCHAGINRSATVIGLYLTTLYTYKHIIMLIESANYRRRLPALTNTTFKMLILKYAVTE